MGEQQNIRCNSIYLEGNKIVVEFYDKELGSATINALKISHKRQILKNIITQLRTYDFQKDILEETPYKIIELKKFGLHPDIEKEFSYKYIN